MRTVAIYGGGDWNDASCTHLEVPDNIDLDIKYEEYCDWLKYCYKPGKTKFYTFPEWLVHFCSASTEHAVEEFHE